MSARDIVERLRKKGQMVAPFDEFDPPQQWVPDHLCAQAADEIERLRAQNHHLTAALAARGGVWLPPSPSSPVGAVAADAVPAGNTTEEGE